MKNDASSVLFRRMPYYLSPQLDLYERLVPFVRNKRVLEVGFGTGIGVLQYASNARFVNAIEIDEAAVRFARRCFRLPNVSWEQCSVEAIDGKVAEFIVMIEVLEHVTDANRVLRKTSEALRPKGHALVTVPNKLRDRRKDDPLIAREWNAEEFLTELLSYFEDVRFLNHELREYVEFPDNATATPLIALCS